MGKTFKDKPKLPRAPIPPPGRPFNGGKRRPESRNDASGFSWEDDAPLLDADDDDILAMERNALDDLYESGDWEEF